MRHLALLTCLLTLCAPLLAQEKPAPKQPRKIELPKDEAPHGDPMEWWYYTGQLKTKAGARYGFEVVVFRFAMGNLPFYLCQFALTDVAGKKFHHGGKVRFGPQKKVEKGFDLIVGPWRVTGHAGKDRLRAALPEHEIDLRLETTKPAVHQYGKGWMTLGDDRPFYYYSYTRMKVTGTLQIKGKPEAVTGEAWMDHQWGHMGKPGVDFEGWDWFSLRLDDNTELMLFVVRKTKTGKNFVGGTWVLSDGKARELKANEFTVTATGAWKSPNTQATYPMGWRIAVPSLKLKATLEPVLTDQEVHKRARRKSAIYWEGLCDLSGTRDGKKFGGVAYVELSGYVK